MNHSQVRDLLKMTVNNPLQPTSECPICLEQGNLTDTTCNCNEKYHQECLQIWFQKNNTCPTCRQVINPTLLDTNLNLNSTIDNTPSDIPSQPRVTLCNKIKNFKTRFIQQHHRTYQKCSKGLSFLGQFNLLILIGYAFAIFVNGNIVPIPNPNTYQFWLFLMILVCYGCLGLVILFAIFMLIILLISIFRCDCFPR